MNFSFKTQATITSLVYDQYLDYKNLHLTFSNHRDEEPFSAREWVEVLDVIIPTLIQYRELDEQSLLELFIGKFCLVVRDRTDDQSLTMMAWIIKHLVRVKIDQ